MRTAFLALAAALVLGGTAAADERVDHYEGEQAETLAQAVANFSDYNARLAEVLGKDGLEVADMETVHELTYTLENALAALREELEGLAATLEDLHLASEAHDVEETRRHGAAYLDTARTVFP